MEPFIGTEQADEIWGGTVNSWVTQDVKRQTVL